MIIYSKDISDSYVYSRIVSVVPSQTELLHDLGLDEEVIAITKFCIHPNEWFKNKTRIGGTKNLHIESIKKLKPDLIIANIEENTKEQIENLAKDFDVYITDVKTLNDALQMIKDIAKLTGKQEKAFALLSEIETKFHLLKEKNSKLKKINTAYVIWKDPYMAAGANTFINDMMQYCGLINIFTNGEHYPEIDLTYLKNCELIILSSEPYPFKEKHIAEIQSFTPSAKIVLADGEMFSWYGSRLLKAVDYFEKFRSDIKYNLLN